MPKYRIYAIASASWAIGEYEAKDAQTAKDAAHADPHADWHRSLCHQCSGEMEVGDSFETQAEETE